MATQKEETKVIGFQLDKQRHRRLLEMAKRYQMSAGQYARELVIRSLDSNDEGILQALNMIFEKVSENQIKLENLSSDTNLLRTDVSHDLKTLASMVEVTQKR
jgi:replication initiation and membrane attachment protein DnaB